MELYNRRKHVTRCGQRGPDVRSDCYVEIALDGPEGIEIQLTSKVESMYGESIQALAVEMGNFFGLKKARLVIEDQGALPATLAARIETAIKRLLPDLEEEFLLPLNEKALRDPQRDRLRRSRLYIPGNEPKYFPNAGLHKPDAIILDLEDSVLPSEKDAARLLVRNTLRSIAFDGAERMVRVNQLPAGLEDLRYVVPHNVNVVLIPKCESAEDVLRVDEQVQRLKGVHGITTDIYYMPIIESALGVVKAYEIASASPRNCALAIGIEDYTEDIGAEVTSMGRESLFARSAVVNAAKAAGIQALDSVFSDVEDLDGLKRSTLEAKALGFDGKGCIHPQQIRTINQVFTPSAEEIDTAKEIVSAFEQAQKHGLGVVSVDGKMVDLPVLKKAQRVIDLALSVRLIPLDWRGSEEQREDS